MSLDISLAASSADAGGKLASTKLATDLLQLASQLTLLREPTELYTTLVRECVALLPSVDAVVLWLYNQQQAVIVAAATDGMTSAAEAISQVRLRRGEGLVGTVVQREEPLRVEGRAHYRELMNPYSQRNQEGLRQLIDMLPRDMTSVLLPLRVGSDMVGVLELLNTGNQAPLHNQDVPHVHMFARIISSTIRSAQVHMQMQADQRRLETLGAISTAVSTASDLDELVDNTLDVLLGVVNANAGMLLLYNPSRTSLILGAHRQLPEAYVALHNDILVADAPCAEAVRYGQPISRPLLFEQEHALISTGLSSCIYLPLLAGGTVAGVACLYGEGPLYERIDTRALMMMSSLVGFAIANVTLYTYSEVERQRLAAVVGGIAEGVFLCDGEGKLILANQTAMNLLSLQHIPYGQHLSEMPDFYVVRRLDGEPLQVEELPLALALDGQILHDYRVLLRGASGADTVMSFSGGPVSQGDLSQGAVVVFRDVTASQKVERAKDDFLAVAAHELRSPLAAVRSYTDLLVRREQKRDEDSPDLRGLTILTQQVTNMLRMVDNLLDVSRLDADQVSLQLQSVNLVALIQQVIEQQRPALGERRLEFNTKQQDVSVVCDPLRVRQVLVNLVGNAIRYSGNETMISVTVSELLASEIAAAHPDFVVVQHADYLLHTATAMALVAVSDQGTGIAEEQRARLFGRYARGRERRGEGLGLGLYLSREFVVRHSGVIWVESQPGAGSTFYVALPVKPPMREDL